MKLIPDISRRALVALGILAAVVVTGLVMLGWGLASQRAVERDDAQQGARTAEAEKATAVEGVDTATDYLAAVCEAGDRGACRLKAQLDRLGAGLDAMRDDPELQESEVQEPEIQEPERQDPENQDAERQDPETQDGDPNDPEAQDDEVDDAELQDDEVQDPEDQEPEIQDPEIDDPDPNSVLEFRAADTCTPAEGEVLVDVGLVVDRGDGVVTYTITCQTTPMPGPPAGALLGTR